MSTLGARPTTGPSGEGTDEEVDALVIGGGPAGLTAAAVLAPNVPGEVVLLDRETDAGGIPRHSNHLGYGIRDMHRFFSGPVYAERLIEAASRAGATIRTQSMVTGWAGDRVAEVTSPRGRYRVRARAVVLATGARERPRTARLVPGDRPAGVLTTGQLQSLVHLHGRSAGARAVVVGSELVSWSAVLTLRESGTRTVLMTSLHQHAESPAALTAIGRVGLRVPVARRTRVVQIVGKRRVEAVDLEHVDTGQRRRVECDTVVFTGDWIPDHELAHAAGLDLDSAGAGPVVDASLRTSHPGVFAIGNLVHPVDTADVAALDGRHVAEPVLAWLRASREPSTGIRMHAEPPLRWISPGLIRPDDPAPPRGRLLAWTNELVRHPRVVAIQEGIEIAHVRVPWPASPGRMFRVPWSLVESADRGRGDVTIGLR